MSFRSFAEVLEVLKREIKRGEVQVRNTGLSEKARRRAAAKLHGDRAHRHDLQGTAPQPRRQTNAFKRSLFRQGVGANFQTRPPSPYHR